MRPCKTKGKDTSRPLIVYVVPLVWLSPMATFVFFFFFLTFGKWNVQTLFLFSEYTGLIYIYIVLKYVFCMSSYCSSSSSLAIVNSIVSALYWHFLCLSSLHSVLSHARRPRFPSHDSHILLPLESARWCHSRRRIAFCSPLPPACTFYCARFVIENTPWFSFFPDGCRKC